VVTYLLGTSIVMIKGYFDNVSRGYQINEFSIPIFNPTELIKINYEKELTEDNTIDFNLIVK